MPLLLCNHLKLVLEDEEAQFLKRPVKHIKEVKHS